METIVRVQQVLLSESRLDIPKISTEKLSLDLRRVPGRRDLFFKVKERE